MLREGLGDLMAFMAVSEDLSFTRAAAKLGVSQSALSHAMRRLEGRLGVRLLMRTTRSVAPTEAGERLLATLGPALASIDREIGALGDFRDRPTGTIRITTSRHAATTVLWPAVDALLAQWPEVGVELSIDSGLSDIVADRFDAGVRLGEALAKDMIAVRIGGDLRMAVVGAPGYFERRPPPIEPRDLAAHDCINLRLRSAGGFYAWELEKDGHEVRVKVEGQFACNDVEAVIRAAQAGRGLAFVMEDQVAEPIAEGRLVRVLADWCPPFPGYHLYYPSRRQQSAAFTLFVDLLRKRAAAGRQAG